MKSALRISAVIAGVLLLGVQISNAQIQPAYPQQGYPQQGYPQQQQPATNNGSSRSGFERGTALNRGNFAIGSGLGYVNSVTNIQIENDGDVTKSGNSTYSIHLTPSIGYFFARNFVFGLGMDYLVSSSRDNTDNTGGDIQETSDDKLLFGPYTRIYMPFGGDQAFFIGAVYGYGRSKTLIEDAGESQTVNTSISTLGVGPGYTIFANRRAALEVQAKYNYGYSRNTIEVDGVDRSTRTLTTAWDFVVGIHFYFNNNSNRARSN